MWLCMSQVHGVVVVEIVCGGIGMGRGWLK